MERDARRVKLRGCGGSLREYQTTEEDSRTLVDVMELHGTQCPEKRKEKKNSTGKNKKQNPLVEMGADLTQRTAF